MRPLRLAGAMKVAEGLTTIEEVLQQPRRQPGAVTRPDACDAAAPALLRGNHSRRGRLPA